MLHQLITKNLAHEDGDSPTAKTLKTSIKKSLITRFKLRDDAVPKNLTSTAMVACFLDPRYKTLKMLTEGERENVITYVQGLVPDPVEPGMEPAEPAVKQERASNSCLFDCLLGDVEIDLTTPAAIQQECEMYLNEPVRMADPLNWWKANEHR